MANFSKCQKGIYSKTRKFLGKGLSIGNSFVADKGKGCFVFDLDGNSYLDFTSGIGVLSTGHSHPRIIEAVQKQSAKIVHSQINISMSTPITELVESLRSVIPSNELDSFVLSTTGAEAVENAIKLARTKTGRQNIICFLGSYHGRSNATAACTSSKIVYRQKVGPFMPGVFFFPHPFASQLPRELRDNPQRRSEYCLEQLELLLRQQTSPEDTAAILVEPVLGEGGYVVPPTGFLEGIQKICRKHKMVFIVDEVQTGFGRTGKFFAYEHWPELSPDIVVMAKGIASGYPLSVVAAKKSLTDCQEPMTMGGTYAGNAVSCAAAVATIKVIKDEKLTENSGKMGALLKKRLLKIQTRFENKILDVRGIGLMAAIEFNPEQCPGMVTKSIISKCSERGLLLISASAFEVIRFVPPLVVTENEIEKMIEIFENVLSEIFE